jgi:hypothetical protein
MMGLGFISFEKAFSWIVFSRERSSTGSNDCFVVVVVVLLLF